jgi:hypothetical protein
MAVNHADGTLFASVLFYPVVAAMAGASAGAGWFTALLIPAGLALGLAVTCIGRRLIYLMMAAVVKRTWTVKGWAEWILGVPMLVLYFTLPYSIVAAGLCGTWYGSIWLVRNIP